MERSNTLKVIGSHCCEVWSGSLKNGDSLITLFADIAPIMEKEQGLLGLFVEADSHTALFNVRNSTASEQLFSIEAYMRSINEDCFIARDVACMVCEA